MQNEYFQVEEPGTIKGLCQHFISPEEDAWRLIQKLEENPYQKIAKYIRNKQYCPANIRTFETLKESLTYLIKTIAPLLLKKSANQKDRYSIAVFLQQRLKAIRGEFFVQGIICPKEILRLNKVYLLVEMMKQSQKVSEETIGMEYLTSQQYRGIMQEHFFDEYIQALKYSILRINRKQLQTLLWQNQIIFQNDQLTRLLQLRLKIDNNNYEVYYESFSKQQPLVQCLLWRKIQYFKQILIEILKKSFGDVPVSWVFKRLGFQEGDESWINVKQTKQPLKGVYIGYHAWIACQTLRRLLS